jgi:membrane protease YdiL (CAAX protease family)
VLTYAAAWSAFFAATAWPAGAWQATVLMLAGTFAPSVVAMALVAAESGRLGVQALARRVVDLQTSWRWYAFALGYIAALKLLAAALHRVLAGEFPPLGAAPWVFIPFAIAITAPLQAGEEVGWRGYALPRLAARFGLARASLCLGVLWGVWHLPLFVVPGHANYGQSFWFFVFGSTALSVAMAWLFVHTRGSVGLAMLMHSAVNQTNGIVPTRVASGGNPFTAFDSSLITWLFAGLLSVTGAYFLWRMRAVAARHAEWLSPWPPSSPRGG